MVKLSDQNALPPLCSLAFADVDIDTDYPLWEPIVIVRNERTRFYPSNLFATNDPIVHVIFALPIAKNLTPDRVQSLGILRMYTCQPCIAGDLGGPLRKAVDCRITRRNLRFFMVGVVDVCADQTRFAR